MMRRRRPLLRGAMVAGAGYAAGRHGAGRREQEASQDERLNDLEYQQPPPPAQQPVAPAGGMTTDTVQQLKELKGLLDSGVLTQQEFDMQKAKVLGS
jgi:hypothetical protein